MNMWSVLLILGMGLGACGIESGENGGNGKPGRDGSDGQSPICKVEGEFLVCKNADGSVAEIKLPDSSSAITKSASCYLDWKDADGRGNKLTYNLVFLSNKTVIAALGIVYYSAGSESYLNTPFRVLKQSEPLKVQNTIWAAEFLGTKAKLTYKPQNTSKEAPCEIQ